MKKIGIVFLGLIVLLIISGIAYVKYQEYAIEKELDKIKVPASWKVVYEHKASAAPLCGDKKGCPSIVKTWDTGRLYTKAEIQKIFEDAKITLSMDSRECARSKSQYRNDYDILCAGDNYHSSDAYSYSVFQYGTFSGGDKYEITISLSKATDS